jgi:hypothetical protein
VVTWRVESFFGLQLQLQAGRILKESRSRVKRGTVKKINLIIGFGSWVPLLTWPSGSEDGWWKKIIIKA